MAPMQEPIDDICRESPGRTTPVLTAEDVVVTKTRRSCSKDEGDVRATSSPLQGTTASP